MTELALVEVINFALSELIDLVQWWASISIGVIALTYYWEKKLDLVMVVAPSVAYTLFTAYVLVNIWAFGTTMNGYGLELYAMRDAGELSAGGALRLERSAGVTGLANATFWLALVGIYVAALVSLIVTYLRGRTDP